MPSHTFNTIAGTTDTGGTGGGTGGITSNVITNLVADESEGSGFIHSQIVNGGTSATAQTRFGLRYYVSGTAGLRLTATDDSQATGSGSGATRFDFAYARGPNSTSNFQTTYNDQTGESSGPFGTLGAYEWKVTDYIDGEGLPETRLDIRWGSVLIATYLINGDVYTTRTVGNYTYTKGTLYSTSTNTEYYTVTRTDNPLTAYVNNTTSGNITGIKMKMAVGAASNVGGGNVAPLRTMNGSNVDAVNNYDTGWITSNLSTGIPVVINHLPNTATSSAGNGTYIFSGSIELWARASGVSDTKVKDFRFSATTIISL